MCEESDCLVPSLDSYQNGPRESRHSPQHEIANSNGEALVSFHEDALSQAAVGKAQLFLALVLGLGIAADCVEIVALRYILPIAEVHLCIGENEKKWLISITLLSMAGGSFAWGVLGDHLGRRRALISALSVSLLFSLVAAVMPTYGIFMTARFFAGLGVGGSFSLSFSYLSEICSRATRTRYTGILHSFWPLGAIFISVLAHFTLPLKGADIVQDNHEHWTSWHRFLFLSILPTLGCLIGLIWASESPRYLLEASREVEALEVYQRLHKLNQTRTKYGLTELELPSRSAYREKPLSPRRNVFSNNFSSFHEVIQRISTPTHFHTTTLLAVLHLILGFVYMGVSTFTASLLQEYKNQDYYLARTYVENQNFTGAFINKTLENTEYKFGYFKNTTFYHMTLSHIKFDSCYFENVNFTKVVSSISYFENSTIKNCRFVDSDLTDRHFIKSLLINNTFLSLVSECLLDFDYNIFLTDIYDDTLTWAGSMFPALLFMGFILETVQRPPTIFIMLALASFCGLGMFYIITPFIINAFDLIIKVLIMCALNALTMVVIEAYPCHIRCTAHGILRCLFHLASLCAINVYGIFLHVILLFPTVITVLLLFMATLLSTKIQDNSKVLL